MAKSQNEADELKSMLPSSSDGNVWTGLLKPNFHPIIGGNLTGLVWVDGTAFQYPYTGIGNGRCFYTDLQSYTLHGVDCNLLDTDQDKGPFAICEFDPCQPAIKSGLNMLSQKLCLECTVV